MIERMSGPRMWVGYAATVLLAGLAVLPPLVSIAASFTPASSEQWTAGAYAYVIDTYGASLLLSLRIALLVVAASLAIAAPAAWAFVRLPFPGSHWLERLAVLPLTLPGVAVAIALIAGYSSIRGNLLLLIAAQMLYTVPYVVAVIAAALRTLPLQDLDAAARSLGASTTQRYRRIFGPLLLHPIGLAALIAFAISWGEFNVTFLLATPLQMPFSASLYGTYTSNSAAVSGAATAIFLAGALPFLIAFQLIDRRPLEHGQGV